MPVYWYVVILCVVWLPLFVMVLCYSVLFFKASFCNHHRHFIGLFPADPTVIHLISFEKEET